MWSQFTNVTDRRTDRQTTCDRNTALCTKVHRAVKNRLSVSTNLSDHGFPVYLTLQTYQHTNIQTKTYNIPPAYVAYKITALLHNLRNFDLTANFRYLSVLTIRTQRIRDFLWECAIYIYTLLTYLLTSGPFLQDLGAYTTNSCLKLGGGAFSFFYWHSEIFVRLLWIASYDEHWWLVARRRLFCIMLCKSITVCTVTEWCDWRNFSFAMMRILGTAFRTICMTYFVQVLSWVDIVRLFNDSQVGCITVLQLSTS